MVSKHPGPATGIPNGNPRSLDYIAPSSPKQNGNGLFSCLICLVSLREYAGTDYTSTDDDLTVMFVMLRHFRCYRRLRMFVIKE